jgi:LPXTG-motif cell wall-anchored protein
MRILRLLLVIGLGGMALSSLVLSPQRIQAAAEAQDVMHEVAAGDGLRAIAGYYYGDTRQWERIWKANRELIRNPNRIERGLLLRIPDARVPAEPYADFLARIRPPAGFAPVSLPHKTQLPVAQVPAKPEVPAPPLTKAQPVAPAPVTQPSAPAAAPAAPPPSKQVAALPAPRPAKAPVTAPGPTKAAGPSAKPTAPPMPPPKAWYEELMSPDFFTSIPFLGIAGALVIGLAALVFIRRRKSAATGPEEGTA